jgi:hypothetical protein
MQRNTIFFIVVKALRVSGRFPAHHHQHKNCTYSICYLLSLVAATPSVVEMELISATLAIAATKLNKYQMLYVVFELLMMGGETA